MALSALVKERYDAALKSGDLLFFPGDIKRKNAKGMEFEITYAPALAEKPRLEMPQSEDGKKVKVNPFLPPNPALHVKDLDEHRVLLNKFCVTPHHILVVTKEFKMQTEPLLPPDLLATWQCLTTAFESTSAVAFYNCGPFSGASQQHKHVQIMPLPNSGPQPPLRALFNEIQERKAGQIYILEKLPFVHVITPLDRDFIESSPSTEHVEDYLGQMFFGLLDNMFYQLRKHATSYGREISYNFVMTPQFMMLVPRSKEIAVVHHNNQDIQLSINSLGFAGLLLVKSSDQLAALEECPDLMDLLQQVAIPWNPSANDDELEQ